MNIEHADTASKLSGLNSKQWLALWQKHIGSPVSGGRIAPIHKRILTWELEAQETGGLDSWSKAEIKRLKRCYSANPDYRPSDTPTYGVGTEYIRDWNGKRYRVVQRQEGIEYEGILYRSLSEVARVITGTRWSGPTFFGLKGNN